MNLLNIMFFRKQKKCFHRHNLCVVEVFLNLQASISCEGIQMGKDQQAYAHGDDLSIG